MFVSQLSRRYLQPNVGELRTIFTDRCLLMRCSAVSTRLIAVLIVLAPATALQAQFFDNWGGVSYHSSTVEEGIQRGYADVVRSQGMANLLNSQAATEF